ncbi:unnamed protein product [Fraxinus pennsylvanica]|uniref:Cysteine-rich receptor-like protein kinase n=1 Tax=Fraxinus pennsylvanica TaxID=56036 RepID=A0AAD2DQI0_9LAMI|nr:unnamed protein product [Fraxinus pennsylvanica]
MSEKTYPTISLASSREDGFFNSQAGRGLPDTVYGLFLCRGDVNTTACQQCVETATTEVLQRCPKEKRATIWYDYCMLRYSNESIVSRVVLVPITVYLYNTQNITDEPNRFRQLLGEAMNEIASEAANSNPSGKGFATKIVNFTEYENLYTLAQCTPDLSSVDCDNCLRTGIAQLRKCCDNKKGGRVIGESCNIRYEIYPFFNSTVAPAPPRTPNIPPIQPPPPSPSSTSQGNGGISKQVIIAIVVPIAVSFVFFFIIFWTRRTRKKAYDAFNEENDEGNEISSVESLQYDLNAIALATNNFSADNKIGEGGFGSVYKGTFSNGQEIAVKRLSKNSGQGAKEFKNEVVVVAKLQHRNLVRLLGFCLEREEKILVYEFVTNKSLDYFLFDPEKGQMLDWIVGTYGYMSPEYAMHGQFSIKSDVFSFGVLVLEIISGKKNSSFYQTDGAEDLLSYGKLEFGKWRTKLCPRYDEMETICGNDAATGNASYARYIESYSKILEFNFVELNIIGFKGLQEGGSVGELWRLAVV